MAHQPAFGIFCIPGQPGLRVEFQDGQGYAKKLCLKQNKTKLKTKSKKEHNPNTIFAASNLTLFLHSLLVHVCLYVCACVMDLVHVCLYVYACVMGVHACKSEDNLQVNLSTPVFIPFLFKKNCQILWKRLFTFYLLICVCAYMFIYKCALFGKAEIKIADLNSNLDRPNTCVDAS